MLWGGGGGLKGPADELKRDPLEILEPGKFLLMTNLWISAGGGLTTDVRSVSRKIVGKKDRGQA